MRPITRADALLEAVVMRLGKSLAFCTCEVRAAGEGKRAAFSTGTYAFALEAPAQLTVNAS
jgi:acyl-coenzyme A thioesterase PaaI-like protein